MVLVNDNISFAGLGLMARFVQMQCAHVQQSYELRAQNIRGWMLLYLAVRRTGGPRQCVILGSTFCPAQNLIENSKLVCSAELQVTHEQRFDCKQHNNLTRNLHRHRPIP